jgi:pilus assembly protein Flp/PilA
VATRNKTYEVNVMNKIVSFLKDESGASAAEYALILALVGLAIVGAVHTLGNNIGTAMNSAAKCIGNNVTVSNSGTCS